MALTVEDGTGLASADSYISLADARALLQAIGQDLNSVDATAEQQLIKAKDYVDGFRGKLKGSKKTREQSLQFPRFSVYIDGWLLPSDELPQEIKRAQVFAAYEIEQGNNLQSNGAGKKIASEELDALKVSYFKNSSTDSTKIYPRILKELAALISTGLKVVRV